jgi:hypothetical protein
MVPSIWNPIPDPHNLPTFGDLGAHFPSCQSQPLQQFNYKLYCIHKLHSSPTHLKDHICSKANIIRTSHTKDLAARTAIVADNAIPICDH